MMQAAPVAARCRHRHALLAAAQRRPAPRGLSVRCSLTHKGTAYPASSLNVKRTMGEGSFGQVFEGSLDTAAGSQRVVLKRVKIKVEGAEEMAQMEHLMNVHASKVAKGSCADFLGYCEVAPEEATPKLSAGLWLVWKYEGSKTLSYYLRRRDTVSALAVDLGIAEAAVIPTVMKQIFECLASFHGAAMVHRDIKPLNIIYCDDHRRFKLIDLGACADLRTGTNYVPDESILDPNYCPPEQYVLPTDAPHLAKTPLAVAISPMLWAQYKPDRFDTFSAGLIMMQMALPSLRSERALKTFRSSLRRWEYDLAAWRKAAALSRFETEFLDADDGAGWDLAQSLLLPRSVLFEDDGSVLFLNDGSALRISAKDALRHRFIARAATSTAAAPVAAQEGSGQVAVGQAAGEPALAGAGTGQRGAARMWAGWKSQFFAMEAALAQTVSATQKQTATVRKLQKEVAEARASPEELKREEAQLEVLQQRLQGVQGDLQGLLARGANLFRSIGMSRSDKDGEQSATTLEGTGGSTRGSTKGSTSGSARQAATPVARSGLLDRLARRLVALEVKIDNQESATEKLSLTVRKLRREVELGQADAEQLRRAEGLYAKMQRRLSRLQGDYQQVKATVGSLVGMATGEASVSASEAERRVAAAAAVAARTGSPPASAVKAEPAPRQEEESGSSKGSGWFNWGRSKAEASSSEQPKQQPQQAEASTDGPAQFFSAGLKLTGFAAKVAGDIASALREDATRLIKEAEAKERAKLQQREADSAFMAVMRALPGLRSTVSYEAVAAQLMGAPEYDAIPDERRRVLVDAFLQTLREKEVLLAAQARAALKDMYLQRGADHDSRWEALRQTVQREPAFLAVPEERVRREVFEEVVVEAEKARLMRSAQFRAEQGFLQLLTEAKDPPVTAESSWALVKPQMWSDARFQALAEPHRRALFLQYRTQLANTAAAAVAAVEGGAVAATNTGTGSSAISLVSRKGTKPEPTGTSFVTSANGGSGAAAEGEGEEEEDVRASENLEQVRLVELRREQERLKQEYARMEAKLKAMEEKLRRSQQAAGRIEDAAESEEGSAVPAGGASGPSRWHSSSSSNGVSASNN